MIRLAAALAAMAVAAPGWAVEVVIDYSFAPSFYSTTTTSGQQARATVEAAADFFSKILDDTLDPIQTPEPFRGLTSTETWWLDIMVSNPNGTGFVSVSDPIIEADEYRIYVGAHSMPAQTLGGGTYGFASWGSDRSGLGYSTDELNALNAARAQFSDTINHRGESTDDFTTWGGMLKFNTDAAWHYDHTTTPPANRNDLLSVAIHEMGHALGFGVAPQFMALTDGDEFTGAAARAANGGQNPYLDSTGFHWRNNDTSQLSPILGTTILQEPSLDPTVTTGTRKRFTELDAAALEDIGWEIVQPAALPGDLNADGLIDAADYTVWRDSAGSQSVYNTWSASYGATSASVSTSVPEPTALAVIALGLSAVAGGGWHPRGLLSCRPDAEAAV